MSKDLRPAQPVTVRMRLKAYLEVDCKRSPHGNCVFAVTRDAAHIGPGGIHVWQWDGSIDQPTITPSINCQGCGRHFIVTRGNAA